MANQIYAKSAFMCGPKEVYSLLKTFSAFFLFENGHGIHCSKGSVQYKGYILKAKKKKKPQKPGGEQPNQKNERS